MLTEYLFMFFYKINDNWSEVENIVFCIQNSYDSGHVNVFPYKLFVSFAT